MMLKYEGFREDFQFELEYIGKNIIFARFLHTIKMTTFVSDEEHSVVVLENGVVNKPFDSVMVKANNLEEVIRIVETSTK